MLVNIRAMGVTLFDLNQVEFVTKFAKLKVPLTLREKCPNTELLLVRIFLYSDVNLRIQSEYRKIRTRNNSVFGHFLRSVKSVK